MRIVLMLLLAGMAVGGPAAAQDLISISGVVTTRADGLSMPGAVVTVVGSNATTTTAADGRLRCRCRAPWCATGT